jgi:hypothetical protein
LIITRRRVLAMGLALLQSGAFVFLACGDPKTPSAPSERKSEQKTKSDEICVEIEGDGVGLGMPGPPVDCNAPSTKKIARLRRLDGGLPDAHVAGRLAPEHIQAVVRSHADDNKRCYEQGLARDRNLTGKVETKFLIERDGRVAGVMDHGSTITDPEVVKCVQAVFFAMKFDAPVGGVVTVVYPIIFSPEPDK